jgi:hypothetical protein
MRELMKNKAWIFVLVFMFSCNYKTYKDGYGPEDPAGQTPNTPVDPNKPVDPRPTPTPTPPVQDGQGQALFTSKCSSCHNAASLAGRSVAQIQNAIARVRAMANVRASIAELTSISGFLSAGNKGSGNANPGNGGGGDDDDEGEGGEGDDD